MEKSVIKVEGMTCGHCEIAVADAILKLPGVKKAKANRRKKEAAVEYDAAIVAKNDIITAINGTGYQVVQ